MTPRILLLFNGVVFSILFATSAQAATFVESGGKVVIEAESSNAAGAWSQESIINGAAGGAYLIWDGPNRFNSSGAGSGALQYTFRVEKAGNYELRWRSYIGEGNDATESNDSWVRFPSGQNISGQHPINGWTKVYMNQLNQWSWSAKTVDNVGKSVRQFFTEGDHVIEVSGRSRGHAIDRIVLFRYADISFSSGAFDAFSASDTVDGSVPSTKPQPERDPDLVPKTPSNNDECRTVTASGASLSAAKQQFAQICIGRQRQDCDPVSNNRWMCSTGNIDSSTPVEPTTQEPVPEEPTSEQPTPEGPTTCTATGNTFGAAKSAFAKNCPNIRRADCDPIGDGRWECNQLIQNQPIQNQPIQNQALYLEPVLAKSVLMI